MNLEKFIPTYYKKNVLDIDYKKLKSKGILESGDKVILAGGHSYVNGVSSSKMIGGYVEI